MPDGLQRRRQGPKANFVGSWQYSGGTLDGEELTDEYMDMLKEWGLNCILILDEGGTGVLDMFLESPT